MSEKIIIVCPKHGEFEQTPTNHINHKQGCPKCVIISSSKKEHKWLDSLKIIDRSISIKIGRKKYIVDGFDSKTNTIYEFYGDYWHGNINKFPAKKQHPVLKGTYQEIYDKTMKREEELKSLGYKIVSIWESDFDKQTQMDRRRKR